MPKHFLCYDCSKVTPCDQNNHVCSFYSSSNGRILTDEEFRKQYNEGTIHLIDPRTGKPFKKSKQGKLT